MIEPTRMDVIVQLVAELQAAGVVIDSYQIAWCFAEYERRCGSPAAAQPDAANLRTLAAAGRAVTEDDIRRTVAGAGNVDLLNAFINQCATESVNGSSE